MSGWLVLLGVWIQFSVASVQELEPQAAALGTIVVAILLLGGLTVWAARGKTRGR